MKKVIVLMLFISIGIIAQEKPKDNPELKKIETEFFIKNNELDKLDAQLAKIYIILESYEKQKEALIIKRNEITQYMATLDNRYKELLAKTEEKK